MSHRKTPSVTPLLRRSASFQPIEKALLYLISASVWVSGAAWIFLHYFRQVASEYGPQPHPAQPLWLKIHGAFAMGFLMCFGLVLFKHIPETWAQKRHRVSGVTLVMVCAILIGTGWGLYYSGSESLRQNISVLHWVLGLSLPVAMAVHIALALRSPAGGRSKNERKAFSN